MSYFVESVLNLRLKCLVKNRSWSGHFIKIKRRIIMQLNDSAVRNISLLKQRLRSCLATMNNASQKDNERKFTDYIGIRLRQRRIELGLTQTKVSNYLNCSFQQIQKYEKGTNGLSVVKLKIFCEATSTDIDYFFRPLNTLKKQIYINGSINT